MNKYLHGTTILGADTIPNAGVTYTDHTTVLAVQNALKDKGFDPGPLDGTFGPKTAKAIKAMQSAGSAPQTGVIDYGVLAALNVSAPASSGGGSSKGRSGAGPLSIMNLFSSGGAPSASAPGVPGFWSQPVWPGGPIKRWQGLSAVLGGAAIAVGMVLVAKRRK